MGLPAIRILLGVCVLVICSQWLTVCEAGQAELTAVSDVGQRSADDKRADLDKRDVSDDVDEKRFSAFSGDLGKRAQFRTDLGKRFGYDLGKRFNFDLGKRFNYDLGKRFNFDLGKRFNYDLGKRSPYDHYKLDLGKRADDDEESVENFDDGDNDDDDESGQEKRAFRMDLGKRSSSNSAVFQYPADKRAAFNADLGKRSAGGATFRKRRAILDPTLPDDENDLLEEIRPEFLRNADGYAEDALPDKRSAFRADLGKRLYFKSDLGKRAAAFRYDLGKRAYFKSDLGKRAAFNSDLGKRSLYDWKRIFRTDLGK